MRLRNRAGRFQLRAEAFDFARSIGATFAQCRAAGVIVDTLVRSMNTDRMIRKASRDFISTMVKDGK